MTDISGFLTICLKNIGQQSPDIHKPCEQKFNHTEIKCVATGRGNAKSRFYMKNDSCI